MNYSKSNGFTLIELMIVVGIVGILLSLSLGFFGDNVISANRTEGRSELGATAGRLEKCKSLYGSYNNGNCTVALPFNTENNYYAISGAPAAASFMLTATPLGTGPQSNDADCTTLTLDNTGVKGATGADTTVCW